MLLGQVRRCCRGAARRRVAGGVVFGASARDGLGCGVDLARPIIKTGKGCIFAGGVSKPTLT